MSGVRLDGFKQLAGKLNRIAKGISEENQRRALLEAGEIIAEEARQLVPVRTGNLRDSITVSAERLGGAFKVDNALSGGGVSVFVGPAKPDGFYGHMIEFGTVKMAAQPFMRPAFDNTEGQVRSRIASELAGQIERAAR